MKKGFWEITQVYTVVIIINEEIAGISILRKFFVL
jgi:hypothetical protein